MDDILKIIKAPCKNGKTITSNMGRVSGLKKALQTYHTCPGHACFATLQGQQDRSSCPVCGLSRPQGDPKPKRSVTYIPLLPRIAHIVRNEQSCKELYSYIHDSAPNNEFLSDFFGSLSHRELLSSVGGEASVRYDVFITVSTDGFQVYKNRSCDVWPVVAVLMNLSPTRRYAARNVLPLMFISGGKEPKDLQSYLVPLVNELNSISETGGATLRFYDGVERKVRIHLVWFTTDLSALKKCACLTGVKGRTPCRYCLIQGFYVASARGYYFPSWLYQQDDEAKRLSIFNIRRLPRRSEASVHEAIERLQQATTQTARDVISRDTGIQGRSVLLEITTMRAYASFPPDIMHLFYNVQRLLLKILLGDFADISLSQDAIDTMDNELVEFGTGISGQMSIQPRILRDWTNWKAAEHKVFILSYCAILFDGHLAQDLLNGFGVFGRANRNLFPIFYRSLRYRKSVFLSHQIR